jgi:predicted HTH domain antitoxin
MEVLLQVPDDIVETLQVRWADLPRRAVELLAAESYRAGVLTTAEVQRMLGFETRMETDEFLKKEKAYLDYSAEDFERDMETLRGLSDGR